MKFSIGYNYDIKLLSLLEAYRDNIEALYFPMPSQYLGSGRFITQKGSYAKEIPRLIKKCEELNIKSQLLLNATCEGKIGLENDNFTKIIDYIQRLKNLGLKSLVITNPVYISEIKKRVQPIIIESSVNCYVKNVEQALYLKNLGVDILTIDRDINRNIPLIREIRKESGLKIRLMLNEGCLRNCPFRGMLYNYIAHEALNPNSHIQGVIPDQYCIKIYQENPEKFFSIPFVPPDALRHYSGAVDYYKLTTRAFSTYKIESCLKAYIKQRFSGNLLQLLNSPGISYFSLISYDVLKKNNYFTKMVNCAAAFVACGECGYCSKLMESSAIINSYYLQGDRKSRENKKAITLFNKMLKFTQDKIPLHLKLIEAYFNLGEYEKAIVEGLKVTNAHKQGKSAYILGVCYEKTGQYKKAIAQLKKAQKANPRHQISNHLAKCYINMGKNKLADDELKNILAKYKIANTYTKEVPQ